MRMHTEIATPDKEPWSFGWQFEAINKRAIELRYELLPYIYNVMQHASETGVPALRPLFLEFPDDEHAAATDDEFLFGSGLLVTPVLWEGVVERDVYLPAGDWFDYWTGRRYAGETTIHVPVTLDSIPMFVRGGAFIFRQPIVQNTGEMPGNPLHVLVAPAAESQSSLYEDDGESLQYRKGHFLKRRFHQVRKERSVTIEISAPEGSYRPAKRDLLLETWLDDKPKAVTEQSAGAIEGETLPQLSAADLAKVGKGWSDTDGLVTVKDNDHFEPVKFTIEH
jgi:alpha-glucosidase